MYKLTEDIKEYQRRYYEANKEKICQQHKAWQMANKGYQKRYREANKEKLRQQHKTWRMANKEKLAEYQRKQREKNAPQKAANKLAKMLDMGVCPINDQCELWCNGCDCEQTCDRQPN